MTSRSALAVLRARIADAQLEHHCLVPVIFGLRRAALMSVLSKLLDYGWKAMSLTIDRVSTHRSNAGFDLAPLTPDQRTHLEADLTPEEAEVLLRHGTEAAFCGGLLDEHRDGVFTCRLCGLPLFLAGHKFESGTGWPSFTAPFDEKHLDEKRDTSYGMVRTELLCARCGSHQGHVFPDGPPPTRQRYCINSISLEFTPRDEPLPDKLERGTPEGAVWPVGSVA